MELLYNPELMSAAELDSMFVDRSGTKITEMLSFIESRAARGGWRHALIVGQRGLGKTTFQLKLRSAVNEGALREGWLPLKFPEELYGVSDLADLFMQVGRLLTQETADETLRSELDELAASASGGEALESGALKLLKSWHNNHRKSLLLLIENLDQLLDQFADEDDINRLTKVLKANPFLFMVGTSIAPLDDGRVALARFGKLFQIFPLTRLSSQEIHEVLLRRAQTDGIKGFEETLRANATRLRALEHFTGGIPRLVLMLYRVLTQSDVGEVQRGLEKLLDQVTPYFKAKVESLPPQQRKILDHVARATSKTFEGVMPAEIAAATRLTPNQVSAQLRRLATLGYVRLADSEGRNNYYTLSEPLYAIWHRMRLGRDERQRMQWLIDFVKAWYDSREMGVQSARLMVQLNKALKTGEFNYAFTTLRHMTIFKDAMEGSPAADSAMFQVSDGEFKLIEAVEAGLVTAYTRLGKELPENLRSNLKYLRLSLPLKTLEPVVSRKFKRSEAAAQEAVDERSEAEKELWRKYIRATYELMFERKYEEALSELRALEKTDFDRFMLWLALGNILDALGRYEEAIEYERKVLSLHPDNPSLLKSLGELYRHVGRYGDGLECFERAVALDPDLDGALYGLGVELNRVERHEEAIKNLDRALEINPFMYKAWFYRGLSLHRLGKYDEALQDYARCLEIDPNNHEVFSNRGWLLDELGRYEEALEELNKSLAIESEQVNAWYIRGVVLNKLKRYEEALDGFVRATRLDPEHLDAWANRGCALLCLDRYDEAVISLDRALQIDSSCDAAWWNRGLCLYELSRHKEAAESFTQTLKVRPDDAVVHYYLGLSLHALKRYEEALPHYIKAVSLEPLSLKARFWRSAAYFNLSRYDDALQSLDDLLSAETNDPEGWLVRPLGHIFKFEVLAWIGKTELAANEWNVGFSKWRKEMSEGRPTEEQKKRWFGLVTQTLTTLADRKDLREFIREHISRADLEDQMFPLTRALDFLLSGDNSYIDRLSPEVRDITQDIVNKLRRADESEEENEPEREEVSVS